MKSKEESENPIVSALNAFIHAVRDIEVSARLFVPTSAKILSDRWDETLKKIDKLIEESESPDDQTRAKAQSELDSQFTRLERLKNTHMPREIEKCLFIGLFSAYDAFIGDLLKAIFAKRPDLLNKISKAVSLSDIIGSDSIQSLKNHVLDEYIDDLRRDNYTKQFATLESLFSLKLTEFDAFSDFIEASQRRHLFTHCNGVVSSQYLQNCEHLKNKPSIGDQLKIGPEYFLNSCSILFEVGIKLGHTLWRKQFPDELKEADEVLSDTVYELLKNERWDRAKMIGQFAYEQKRKFDKQRDKITAVNYCIALKFGKEEPKATAMLESQDWSDSLPEFKLAKAVLCGDYKLAAKTMILIGKEGELVSERSYHNWPLFKDFRSQNIFRETYEKIYGYSFIKEVRKELEERQNETPPGEDEQAEQGGGYNSD